MCRLVSLTGWGLRRRNDPDGGGTILRRANLMTFPQLHCNRTHRVTHSSLAKQAELVVPELFRPEVMCAGLDVSKEKKIIQYLYMIKVFS